MNEGRREFEGRNFCLVHDRFGLKAAIRCDCTKKKSPNDRYADKAAIEVVVLDVRFIPCRQRMIRIDIRASHYAKRKKSGTGDTAEMTRTRKCQKGNNLDAPAANASPPPPPSIEFPVVLRARASTAYL